MVNRTHVSEIRVVGRNTQGVRIMNLNEGDKIASIAKVAQEEVEAERGERRAEEAPTPPTHFSGDPKGVRSDRWRGLSWKWNSG